MSRLLCTLLLGLLPLSCSRPERATTGEAAGHASTGAGGASAARVPVAVTFADVTDESGLRFRHNSGAFGQRYLPETMGSGAAFVDVDADGWQDIFLVNSTNWPGQGGQPSFPALYRNNRNGTFTDITAAAGLRVESYGMGVAAADFDNDGLIDLYLTALGRSRLFRNTGHARFVDVTDAAGVGREGFSTSATWFDYDRDGHVDLFVPGYVKWTVDTDLFCTLNGTTKSYCTPATYRGESATLYHNMGNGTFEDVTKRAGLDDPTSKALGVALLDYDTDTWLDMFVANDTQPHRLYRNNRDGTFTDVALLAGVALNEAGVARAGMGVDAADYDGSGRHSLVIGNFSNEMMNLYTNEGSGLFVDQAPRTSIGRASLLTLTFGAFFFDHDLDGLQDIFAANGHVADDIATVQSNVTYAQPPHLFRNLGSRRFEEVTRRAGVAFQQPMVARGAAYGDYDRDGDLDLLVSVNNGPARLLRNEGGNRHSYLRVLVTGGASNRSGIGTRVQALIDGMPGPWAMVKTGSSYLSQSELPVTLGLGTSTRVSGLRVTWPNGRTEDLPALDANQAITVVEGRGIVANHP